MFFPSPRPWTLFIAGAVLLCCLPGLAQAQVCVDGTPSLCAPAGSPPICVSAPPTLVCDTDLLGGPNDVNAWAILEQPTLRFEVFGNDSAGNSFCCQIPAPGISEIHLVGSPNNDNLSFYFIDSGLRWDLGPAGSALSASAWGLAGQDKLYGGDTATFLYDENLHGGPNRDELYGNGGDDDLYGGDGNDEAWGGDGEDYIAGGAQNDDLRGGPGRDQIYGGDHHDDCYGDDGDDLLVGGPGVDYLFGLNGEDVLVGGEDHDLLWGGIGDDTLCGGNEAGGNDRLYGESGDDLLWGLTASALGMNNEGDGGAGVDRCDAVSIPGYTSCELVLGAAPSSCP